MEQKGQGLEAESLEVPSCPLGGPASLAGHDGERTTYTQNAKGHLPHPPPLPANSWRSQAG